MRANMKVTDARQIPIRGAHDADARNFQALRVKFACQLLYGFASDSLDGFDGFPHRFLTFFPRKIHHFVIWLRGGGQFWIGQPHLEFLYDHGRVFRSAKDDTNGATSFSAKPDGDEVVHGLIACQKPDRQEGQDGRKR